MSVHYKFKSALDYDTVTFDGLHISVSDLKKSIVHQKRIGKNTDFDLQVTNAQTKEVYNDENALIPKNTSLIIARVPLAAQPNKGRTWNETTQGGLPARNIEDSNAQALSKAVDLTRLDASEEDKIRAMMTQSTLDYDPSNYLKIRGANQMGEVPANYRCYKCHQPGHWIKNCPLGLSQEPVEIKKSTGIPRSFMVPVDGPLVPGAMMTPTGQYAVPALDHQAYNSDGGGRGGVETEPTPDIPEDLLCSICKDLLTDAVMIPCCGNSFCDECIRTTLLESEDHECPDCHEKDISPATLIPNRFLRNSVSNFKNETGYHKVVIPKKITEKPADESAPDENNKGLIISEADSTGVDKSKEKEEGKTKSYPQVVINALTGEIQPKITSSQDTSSQNRPTITAPHAGVQASQAYNSEERAGTPTVDEPGITPTQPNPYPAGDTPPFVSQDQNMGPRPQNIPTHGGSYPPAGYGQPQYSNAYPPVRRPPGPDYNPRPYMGRMPYDQVRPPGPMGPYDPARPPPPYQGGYPPRHGGPPMGGPRSYGPPPMRNPPPGIRPMNPTGVIDDPLAEFEKILREKDERDRRVREFRKSRSRSFSPRSRRTRSSSRSYSPRSRTPRSRSPPPKSKLRNRSRTPRSISRSRSRSRVGIIRRSRTPRSRERSFSMGRKNFRSRSFSRSVSPREFSPRRRPISRGRYRSPHRGSPPRYRYPNDRRGPNERDRGYHPPPRDREFGGNGGYYDGPPHDFDRNRINDREKDFDRERHDGRSRRGMPMRGRGRYLPSPLRKEFPLVPQNAPQYYSLQEHAVYHHQNPTPNNRLPPTGPGRMGGPLPPQVYPPTMMNVKTLTQVETHNFDPPAPPGTEEPPVPGFESPRLMYDRNLIPDAPPGVDPHATDTVLTKPTIEERPKEIQPVVSQRSSTREHRSHDYSRERRKDTTPDKRRRVSPSKDKHSKSPHRHRHKHDERHHDERPEKKHREREKESSDDEKSKKSKDKKRKRKEREKEKEAEKNRKKEEKRKRKEQEKIDKIKKAEDKKLKVDEKHKADKKVEVKEENSEGKENLEPVKEEEIKVDLYGDVLSEGIDNKVVQNYGKIEVDNEDDIKGNTPEREPEDQDEKEQFDCLDLYANENDILKSEDTKKSKDVLITPVPELSKWEVDDEAQNEKRDDENDDDDDDDKDNKVTSEVLKHAENAIFKKAINAIRPIEIKTISKDRVKLYSGEKDESNSPIDKDSINPANIQITIPQNEWGEVRLVDINPASVEPRSSREISSAVQKPTPPVRLSVRERLGSKVEELDKITKEDRHYDRNRSRTLSPLSKREREEANRRVVEVDRSHRHHNWNSSRNERKPRIESIERNHNNRRIESRRTHREEIRHDRRDYDRNLQRKKLEMKYKEEKHRERKRSSRTPSTEHKSRKKDKKHKKEKIKRSKKEEEEEKREEVEEKPVEVKDSKKIVERRKPTLDEANFEPDYDLDTESESDNKPEKKRDRSKSNDEESIVKKRKTEEKKVKKEIHTSSSDSSSDSSSSEDEKPKKKHKKHKKKKSSKKVSSSSSDSETDSSSDEDTKRRKVKSKKHKSSSKKSMKKKKKSKHK